MFVSRVFLLLLMLCPSLAMAGLPVAVSVLPHKMLVEEIAGKHVDVTVIVGKGFDPATYQPTPRQISVIANAQVYLRTGVPFENSWLPRFRAVNPGLQVVDLRDGIELIPAPRHAGGAHAEVLDPHIWTDPQLMQHQAALVRDLLQLRLSRYKDEFSANYQRLSHRLQDLDQEISRLLGAVEERRFLVFHPAWGYFARRYGWKQLAAEHDGKEPNARGLARLMEQAREQGIRMVIVQPQNHSKTASALAQAIGGKLVVADPLAEDYFSGLREFASLLGGGHD